MTTVLEKKCIDCGKTTTYVYKRKASWHRPKDGRQGFQCHSCYSTSRKKVKSPMPQSAKERFSPVRVSPKKDNYIALTKSKAKPTLAEKFAETKRLVAETVREDVLQKICKSYTNFYEEYRRQKK